MAFRYPENDRWPEFYVHWRYDHRICFRRPVSKEAGGLTEFRKRTEVLRAEWEKLKVARDQFLEDPRHKVFAHLELVEVPIEYPEGFDEKSDALSEAEKIARVPRITYQRINTPAPQAVAKALDEIVPAIGKCIDHINYVWAKAILVYRPQYEALKKMGKQYWK
jgi:hypothetical protein